ncbi:hypothetical protein Droror1_Dr00015946 [Drosera rotundifolia]
MHLLHTLWQSSNSTAEVSGKIIWTRAMESLCLHMPQNLISGRNHMNVQAVKIFSRVCSTVNMLSAEFHHASEIDNRGVRLWKPMVKEEFGEGDINFKSSPESTPKGAPEKSWASQDKREDQSETSMATTDHQPSQRHDSRLNSNHGGVMSGTTERQLQFNPHGDDTKNYGFMRLPNDHYSGEGSLMMAVAAGYQLSEVGSFTVDNQHRQVMVTLSSHQLNMLKSSPSSSKVALLHLLFS